MKRVIVLIVLALSLRAEAHVGSPDVFFEGDAGPYHLFVTVRMPQVIPGVADIEIRTSAADVTGMTVVPLRLTGPGSELPPTPDRAQRSTTDRQFFSASLWLMEWGALQVRIAVDGARGAHTLAVPINAAAQKTLPMDRKLAALLLALMALLALSLVSIAASAVREGALDPGAAPSPRARRNSRIALGIAGALVLAVLYLGDLWWRSDASEYESYVDKPWIMKPVREGCTLTLPSVPQVIPDHGHDMHVFMVRTPGFDRLAHLHPTRMANGSFMQSLPSLPAGHYKLFVDVVFNTGYPATATAELDLPDLTCPALAGDDSAWDGVASQTIRFERPLQLRARAPQSLQFRVTNPDGSDATIEPYMGMAGHAAIVARDLSVFAHLHPNGSVAMPALMLAGTPHAMYGDGTTLPGTVAFPYGFPHAGEYRVFVQVKRGGRIETGEFDVSVAE